MDEQNNQGGDVNFSSKASSFKEIIMEHIRRITRLSSCELRGGYYTTFVTKNGEEKEHYVEDTRETLENSIYCLAQLTMPRFTKAMAKYFSQFEEECNVLKNNFLEKTKMDETEVMGEAYYDDKEKILLFEYKIKKMNLYKHLFTELVILLAAKNYLEASEEMF